MDFLIADTFTDSLAKLTGNEQKAAKTTAFDLQLNPAQPGHRFHKVDRARGPGFWSVRVNRDVRMVVHRTGKSLLLCYVDHHDRAYHWAERRKLVTHPTTGAAQLVEVRETVEEIKVPRYVDIEKESPPKSLLFKDLAERELLSYGVPLESLDDVRNADEDSLLDIADRLPEEAAEALLKLAVGETPQPVQPDVVPDPFEHPDAQRRFRVIHDVAELEHALEYPAEKWAVFLHPAQRQVVEANYGGPARVSGPAGTGKTIVAIHRAVFLARANPDARVLLTTISDALAEVLRAKLKRLIRSRPRLAEHVEVDSIDAVGERLYGAQFGPPRIATRRKVRPLLAEAAEQSTAERVQHPIPAERVGEHRRRLATGDLGGLPGRQAAGTKDTSAPQTAFNPLVDLRTRQGPTSESRSGNFGGHVQLAGGKAEGPSKSAVRLRNRG